MDGLPRRLVLVEWEDASGGMGDWVSLDDLPVDVPYLCASVGWLVAESKDRIIIVANIATENERHERQGCHAMTIPRSMIRRIVTLPIPERKTGKKKRTRK